MSEKINEVAITVEGDFVQAGGSAVMGDRRLVRYFPVGLPGAKGIMRPCVWMSAYEVFDSDLGENVKICLLLLNEGPPKPEIIGIRIPSSAIEKFPMGPVGW